MVHKLFNDSFSFKNGAEVDGFMTIHSKFLLISRAVLELQSFMTNYSKIHLIQNLFSISFIHIPTEFILLEVLLPFTAFALREYYYIHVGAIQCIHMLWNNHRSFNWVKNTRQAVTVLDICFQFLCFLNSAGGWTLVPPRSISTV